MAHLYGGKMKIWKLIFYWLLVFFIIYLIIEIIRKMLGGSLGFEEIIIGLLVANLAYSFHINTKLSEHVGWHKGRGDSH